MITVAICDDNSIHLQHTAQLLRKEAGLTELDIDTFPCVEALYKCLAENDYRPDIAILDIVLGKKNGIEVAREFNRYQPDCRIIFLSGYPEYITASYKAEHVWFVLKSQADEYLGQALRKALSDPGGKSKKPGITIRTNHKAVFVPLAEILYIDRDGRKTRVVCLKESYLVSGPPAMLLTDSVRKSFVRCHQSYWVNLAQVRELDHEEFVLESGQRVPIGRTYRADARKSFFDRYRG